MGDSFNRGERVREWGGHDHAGRTCRLGGYGGGSGNACFKCGVTGHMARDCHQVAGRGGGGTLAAVAGVVVVEGVVVSSTLRRKFRPRMPLMWLVVVVRRNVKRAAVKLLLSTVGCS